MQEISCAFTGHRPKKFPWGYDEADARCVALRQTLTKEIVKLIEVGYMDFLSGMAEGAGHLGSPGCSCLEKRKSRTETPLCPALRGTGKQMDDFGAGTLFFYSGAGGRDCVCQPGV